MAEQPGGDKTEAPTEKRRRDAARKGERPDLKELGVALVTLGGALWALFLGSTLVDTLGAALREGLSFDRDLVTHFDPARAALRIGAALAAPLAALFALSVAGALAAWAIGGAGVSPSRLAPDPKRLDPIAGLGRLLGTKGLIELGKSLLKLAVVGAVAGYALLEVRTRSLALAATDPAAAVAAVGDQAANLLLLLACGLLLIAVVDAPVAFFQFLQRLRMTKEEVRREHKEQEGSPELKGAQRRRQREAARAGVAAATAGAHVVITNPTHFAVALRYRRGQDRAPVVVARGRGELALAIRAAREHGLETLDYPELARALYFTSRRDGEIAPDLYVAVAAVLAFVFNLARPGPRTRPPHVDVPDPLRFDEHGRRMA